MSMQLINAPINHKNEGILFVGEGIPASRPLHIYRKTGASCVSNNRTCTVSDKPLKMLGKNASGMYTPPNRCRNVVATPYYSNYSAYLSRKCVNPATAVSKPMYTIYNPNNKRFSTQGAVSESALTNLKKYEAIIENNNSIFNTYKTRLRYTDEPVFTLKNIIEPPQNCNYNNTYHDCHSTIPHITLGG